ncbi:hypothetical protein Bbelb_116860 [Branchiostoma belcheri]|nr:hypothetical protein Bbelb_116860 [Branchiostoma belcheri]
MPQISTTDNPVEAIHHTVENGRSPSDFYLFPKLKFHLRGQRFDGNDDVIYAPGEKESSGVSSGPPLHGESVFLDDGALVEFLNNYYDKETPPDTASDLNDADHLVYAGK